MTTRLLPLLTALGLPSTALAQYVPGDLYLANPQENYEIYDVTNGGDVSNAIAAYANDYNAGQLTWSLDLRTMYLSLYSAGQVIAIDQNGNVSTYATGLSGPTGLLVLRDGTMLVSQYNGGNVLDITGGGNFSNTRPLVTGLSGPRNLVELDDGRILVCDQSLGGVYNVPYPSGGAATAFATNLGQNRTIVQDPITGHIYTAGGYGVYDITNGGAITSADLYASGQSFFAVAIDDVGNMYAGNLGGSQLWDITGGGDFASARAWASGIGSIESAFNAVPSFSVCGDGVPEGGEDCDDGNEDDTDACLSDCTSATCGDGYTWSGNEDCDDGNTDNTDACLSDCSPAECGDGFVWDGVEGCDDGNADDTDACVACAPAECGDGFVWDGMENCDDGNAEDTDACLSDCTSATCGDGFVWAGNEDCDDANLDDSDDCLSNCEAARCGDGFVWNGSEACDDGNDDDTDDCAQCAAAVCGDGFVWDGVEGCDDGNTDDGDGCDASCEVEEEPGDDTGIGGGDDKDCGCSQAGGGASAGWLALLGLMVLRRRREAAKR
ncbi:MAG: hypothetical protein H6739_31515 [Alphaproteobacteria bacterium]|nr:hypothetical protein [Alphaproteobacteria bacterium]